ncbi:MAG: L-seryl-tRNA(Sec) selenium transferase [Nitriliruptorales bacterium]|nr:L-seryl-tRNA(Sec) selenium transferase [Nitriliruptorales bacterium]
MNNPPDTSSPASPDLSQLPQVGALLERSDTAAAIERYGRRAVANALRDSVDEVRNELLEGARLPTDVEIVSRAVRQLEGARRHRLRRVINATGVVFHTNLGRAPLSAAAREAIVAASGYTTLEYDLAEGHRGSRTRHVGELAAEATGAPAATVVNNGAAALVLALAALSAGRDALVSRGELIEIGGSYRLPDIMSASGATMREVGTTNRTRVDDYRDAITADTGLLLKVHRSNFDIVGFTETVAVSELAALAAEHDLPLVYDLGSGLLHAHGGALRGEPSVEEALDAGADLVLFSGDKLLGGPQAGLIAGREELVDRLRRHPLARAFRIDKLQRAALEATLESYLRDDHPTDLPGWAMLDADLEVLARRARALADEIGGATRATQLTSVVGGGALPTTELASWGVELDPDDAESLAGRLRALDPPVVTRIEEGRVVLDLRTVAPAQDDELATLVRSTLP